MPRIKMNDDGRQDPEAFLDRTPQSRKGKLKVYLGGAAGVGKTYRMLQEGHTDAENGRDVVIGYLEAHGRRAQSDGATLKGMDVRERLSLRRIPGRRESRVRPTLAGFLEQRRRH